MISGETPLSESDSSALQQGVKEAGRQGGREVLAAPPRATKVKTGLRPNKVRSSLLAKEGRARATQGRSCGRIAANFTHDPVRRLTSEMKSHKQFFDWSVFLDGVEQLRFSFFLFLYTIKRIQDNIASFALKRNFFSPS